MEEKFKIKNIVLVILGLSIIFILNGCVKRIVTIDSEPQGAKVYFYNEDKERGVTPCTFDFNFYGRYPVKLVKEGYEDLKAEVYLKAPIYEYFPLDLFSEAVLPLHLTNKHKASYVLTALEKEEE